MSTLSDFNKAVVKSVLAYKNLQDKTDAYNLAGQEVTKATAENDAALEEVKQIAKTLDDEAIKILQNS